MSHKWFGNDVEITLKPLLFALKKLTTVNSLALGSIPLSKAVTGKKRTGKKRTRKKAHTEKTH